MKAIRIHEHGGPENLIYEEIADPKTAPGEVLVNVKATALNHLDIWVRSGSTGADYNLPRIPGSDIAGSVSEIGSEVKKVKEGDEVILFPAYFCGECDECKLGRQTLCDSYAPLGTVMDGGNAEYIVVPERNLLPKPENLSFNEAAAFPLVFLTAWHMLISLGKVKENDRVLVHGAGSGVGMAAIQIAKQFCARVYTTSSSDEKLEKAVEIGADFTINYDKENFQDLIYKDTDGEGVDIVIEHIGPATWKDSIRSLKKGGRLVTCGATTGPIAELDLRRIFSRQISIHGSYMGYLSELNDVLRYINSGALKPVVDSVFDLKDAPDAHRHMENRNQFGKIILNP